MKTLIKLAFITVALFACVTTYAQMVNGHFRSNGTFVAPYYRSPANGSPYDNLSYRGFPSQQPGSVSPRHQFGIDSTFTMPRYDFGRPSRSFGDGVGSGLNTMPSLGNTFRIRNYDF